MRKTSKKSNPAPEPAALSRKTISASAPKTFAAAPLEVSKTPPTREQIQKRAYELYEAGGCVPGRDLENWLKAERELS